MNEAAAYKFHEHRDRKTHDFLREFVYGGVDGGVTTFAVVAGAMGAQFSEVVIIILGLANLIADGFSMSVGSYLSVKSDWEKYQKIHRYEQWGVANIPQMEKEEIRQIYFEKGLRGHLLDQVVDVITADKDLWIEEMMKGEFQLTPESKTPLQAGLYTFLSFILIGIIPLLPFLLSYLQWVQINNPFMVTCVATSISFLLIGWIKALVNQTPRYRAVLETLGLGLVAAFLAYYVGHLLEIIINT